MICTLCRLELHPTAHADKRKDTVPLTFVAGRTERMKLLAATSALFVASHGVSKKWRQRGEIWTKFGSKGCRMPMVCARFPSPPGLVLGHQPWTLFYTVSGIPLPFCVLGKVILRPCLLSFWPCYRRWSWVPFLLASSCHGLDRLRFSPPSY